MKKNGSARSHVSTATLFLSEKEHSKNNEKRGKKWELERAREERVRDNTRGGMLNKT